MPVISTPRDSAPRDSIPRNNMPNKEFLFTQRDALYKHVANECATQILRGVEKQGKASIVLAGGTTPEPVFNRLNKMSLWWHNVQVVPSDERWVDVDHEQSNQGLLQRSLLIKHAASAKIIPLKNKAATPASGQVECEKSLGEIESPFDFVLLGMGADGHFASLFPDCAQLTESLNLNQTKKCIAIDATGCPVAGAFPKRMSLTLSAIVNSKKIILIITGKEKLEVLRCAMRENNPSDKPVAALLNQNRTPVDICWAE